MQKLLLLNGPNLNLLGTRQPEVYGSHSLIEVAQMLNEQAEDLGFELTAYQSNAEADLINAIHHAKQEGSSGIIINAGAYSHTSIALRDAFLSVSLPFVEIHISNVFQRESFRQHSYLSDIAIGLITGFGTYGYSLALLALIHHLKKQENALNGHS